MLFWHGGIPTFHSAENTAPSSSSTPSSHHAALPVLSSMQRPGSSQGSWETARIHRHWGTGGSHQWHKGTRPVHAAVGSLAGKLESSTETLEELNLRVFYRTGAGREVRGLNPRWQSLSAAQHGVRAGRQESLLPWEGCSQLTCFG